MLDTHEVIGSIPIPPTKQEMSNFSVLLAEAKWRRAETLGGFCARQGADCRLKKVRAFSNNGHQIGLRDFLWGEAEVCSPRLVARLARNWAVKSNGGAKSQETIFSEMRRFIVTKLCIKINFYSNFCAKYPASRD